MRGVRSIVYSWRSIYRPRHRMEDCPIARSAGVSRQGRETHSSAPIGRLLPLVVLAMRVRGLWLIEEYLPHDPSRKRNEVWVLHESPDMPILAERRGCNSVGSTDRAWRSPA